MKGTEKLAVFVIAAVMLSNLGCAISSSVKEAYAPGETIIAEISGNILEPISASDVEFRRGHVGVPLDYDLKKIDGKYYIWAAAPELNENYTIAIKGISTTISGKVQEIDYEKNFSVLGNITDYSIKPGFVDSAIDFEIKATLNDDYDKEIATNFLEEGNFTLKPGENVIRFSISGINESAFYNVTIGRYNVPAYITINETMRAGIPAGAEYEENPEASKLINISGNITEDVKEKIEEQRKGFYCSEFPGKICAASEKCTGETITSADGACCVNGVCLATSEEESGGYGWIGYIFGAVVVAGGIYLWVRYKRVKKEEPLQKKVSEIEQRMPGAELKI
jgi:hypothetical protein